MAYPVENALFHWEEGERRLSEAGGLDRFRLDRAVDAVLDELRRRLGSSFTAEELADLYGTDQDWAVELAAGAGAGAHARSAVDAAFNRYLRESVNFAGGRRRAGGGHP